MIIQIWRCWGARNQSWTLRVGEAARSKEQKPITWTTGYIGRIIDQLSGCHAFSVLLHIKEWYYYYYLEKAKEHLSEQKEKGERMKKRGFALALAVIVGVAVITGCGGGSGSGQSQQGTSSAVQNKTKAEEQPEAKEEVVEPLDLTGNWAQKGKEGSDSFQAGYIENGVIELFWITDNGNTHMLYWSGSYDAPTSSGDEYTWDSVNDKIKTDSALMASTQDTKTFDYKNGEISYEVSIMGQTGTITLVRSENDYTGFAPAGGSSGEAQDGQQIELVESGYSVNSNDGYISIYYAVKIHNPNEEYAVEFPKIQITARSEDGKILKTDEQVLNSIAANDTIVYGNRVSYEGEEADSVEISVSNGKDDYMHQSGSGVVRQDQLTVSNISENIGEYERTYTGEVTNNSTEDLSTVAIMVIYKNGDEMVGGDGTYVDDLNSGSTKPFEISEYSDLEYDSFEVYALQW